jgi:predicted nuclease with TOPRIM domain
MPSFRIGNTQRYEDLAQHWKEEKKGKEILDEKVRKYASELVAIKTQLNDLVKEEKRLKGKLHEHMEQYSKVTLDDWVVKCRYHKTPASFDISTVLVFLQKEYGVALKKQVQHMCSQKKEIKRLTICVSPNVKPKGANKGQLNTDQQENLEFE